jgi:hypothetical protein
MWTDAGSWNRQEKYNGLYAVYIGEDKMDTTDYTHILISVPYNGAHIEYNHFKFTNIDMAR